jgi:hypothetical protein
MYTPELARRTIVVLAMLVVLASGSVRGDSPLHLIHVHGPDGEQEIDVNVQEISSIRQPRENTEQHFAKGMNCMIYMTNGKFIPTSETCKEIVKLIAALDATTDK